MRLWRIFEKSIKRRSHEDLKTPERILNYSMMRGAAFSKGRELGICFLERMTIPLKCTYWDDLPRLLFHANEKGRVANEIHSKFKVLSFTTNKIINLSEWPTVCYDVYDTEIEVRLHD